MTANEKNERSGSLLPLLLQLGGVGVIVGLIVVLFLVGRPDPIVSGYQQIEISMTRPHVENILGVGKLMSARMGRVGGKETRIEVLEWRSADGRQCVRLEIADEIVISKALHNLGSG